MKQNLLFNQLTAMPKRLAMVLTVLFTLGVGSMLGADTWVRVTSTADILSGGTFIIGYEATANSGEIVPMRTNGADATTSANGYLYSGTGTGITTNGNTINMASPGTTTNYEVTITAYNSSQVELKMADGKYISFSGTSNNNLKLATSSSTSTRFTVEIATNNVVTLANSNYTARGLRYNTSSPRFSNYSKTSQKGLVLYKKSASCSYNINYTTNNKADGAGGTWSENNCFEQVGSTTEWRYEMTLPGSGGSYWVGNGAWVNNKSEVQSLSTITFVGLQGTSCGSKPYPGEGAVGYVRIYSDSGSKNYYAAFQPTYQIAFGIEGQTWTHKPFTLVSGNKYETDLVEIPSNFSSSYNYYVGPKKSDNTTIWVDGKSSTVAMNTMGGMTDVNAVKGSKGVFRIYDNYCDNNWYCSFIPYYNYKLLNDDGSVFYTSTYVSSEAANKTTTIYSTKPTKTGHTFVGWNRTQNATTAEVTAGASYTYWKANDTFYPVWKKDTYTITSNLTNCSSSPAIPASYTYTGSAANLTYTITPASGYRLPDAITVSGCAYTWDKTTGQLKLTGTISGNVTITIEAVKVYTITWKVNKQTYTTGSPTQSIDAGKTYKNLTLPTAPANSTLEECYDDKKFVGWSTTNIGSTESDKPSILFKSTSEAPNTTITENTTLYAVFATESPTTSTSTETTTISGAASGTITKVLSWSSAKNDGTANTAWNDAGHFRLYPNKSNGNGSSITITPVSGITINEVVLTATSNTYAKPVKYNIDGGSDVSGTWNDTKMTISDINATSSFKFRNAHTGADNDQVRVTVSVTYLKEISSTETSNYVTECCTLNNINLDNSGTTTGGTFFASVTKACKGEDITLTAEPENNCYEFVSWTIKNTSGTDVTNSVLNGNTLTMPDYAVTVYAKFKSLSVTEIALSMTGGHKNLDVGETNQLLVAYTPADATCDNAIVSWTSSDDNVMSVTSDGLVKALRAGDATITATTEGGVIATYEINVNNPACDSWYIHYWNNSTSGDECFYKVKPDDPNDHEWRTYNFSLPSFSDEDKFIVNNTPEDSYKTDQVFRTGIGFADIQRGGQDCGTNPYPGQDAYGQLSIYDDSETANRYIAFYPAQYLVTYGKDGTAPWEVLPLNNTTGYEYETEPFMVPNGYKTDDTYKYYVGITDKNGNIKYVGYEFGGVEYKKSSVDPMNTVNGLSANDMAGKWGTWHIYSNSCANNWYCEFIHYYRVDFNLNGGEGDFAPRYGKATTPYVTFTTTDIGAPTRTGYTFLGWKDQNNKIYAPTDATVTINKDLTLTALWIEEYGSTNCRWEEVTIDDIEYGDEVVIAMEKDGSTYALVDNNTAASSAPLATEISINANKTINTDITTSLIWNIDYDKEGTKNLVIYSTKNVGKWLYSNNDNDGVRIGTNTNKEFKIVKGIGDDAENTFLYHVAQDRYLGVYYTENVWRGYTLTNQGAFPNNIKGQTLKFYKKVCLPEGQYRVTWDANGGQWSDGSTTKEEIYSVGATINNPDKPKLDGYIFDSWEPTPSTMPAENTTFTAKWAEVCTVIYTVGNGDTAPEEMQAVENTNITLPSLTTNLTCVNFVGWTDAASGYTHGTDNLYKAGDSYTVTDDITLKAVYAASGGFVLVTDASELAIGDHIVIAAAGFDVAMGADKGNNRGEVEVTKDNTDNTITTPDGIQILTLEAGTVTEDANSNPIKTYAFNTGSGYLYAASSSSNHLKTQATNNANGSWTISITSEGVATIKAKGSYTHNWLRYNSGSSIFSCYTSGQADVSIYKESITGYTTDPECVMYNVTLCTPTNGTISVDKAIVDPYGSTILTFAPAAGYMLDAVLVTSGNAEVGTVSYTSNQTSDGTVKISNIQSDIEVCATFVEIPYYKVTFVDMNNGNAETIVHQSEFGGDITAPATASEGCDNVTWTFIGWAPSNSLNGTTEVPANLVEAGGTISGANITNNNLIYYSVYSNSSDGTPPFSIGKSGTYYFKAITEDDKVYYATGEMYSNKYRSNQETKIPFYVYYNTTTKKYTIKNTLTDKYVTPTYDNGWANALQEQATFFEWNILSYSNGDFTLYEETGSINSDAKTGEYLFTYTNKSGNTRAIYFGGTYFESKGLIYDAYALYLEPASEMHYYNASSCNELVTMSFDVPADAVLTYADGYPEGYYKDSEKKTITTFPTLEYAGWTFIGWTASTPYNDVIGEDYLDDENSSADAPKQTIYKTGVEYPLTSDVTMYPVFTKFEDNEPFDMVNGGDYYIYYIADEDIGTSVDEYGVANRIYAAEYEDYGFRSTQSCADATLFTFAKLPNGKWTIYDNTRDKFVYGVNNDNKLEDQAQTGDGKTKYVKEWTIEVNKGNQVNAVSVDGYILSAYTQDAKSGTFKNYDDDNLTNGNGNQYHRVYLGTCTERVYSSNPTNKPAITLSGEPMVTSTADQSIRAQGELSISATKLAANATITLTSDKADVYFATDKTANFSKATKPVTPLTLTADEKGKLAMTTVYVHYKPTSTSTLGGQTANITATTGTDGQPDYATATTIAALRNLPADFVIAAKWGDNWYAMPANMDSQSSTEGLLIEVDNPADPTKAIAAPNTTKYGLKSVYTSNSTDDRFAANGERLVFVENVEETTPVTNKTLYNGGDASGSKTNIQVYAQYTNYYNENPDRYEWIPTTIDLTDYTLTSGAILTGDAVGRTVSLDNHGIFGTLLQDKSYNGMVRLLPVDNFYGPAELQVVEWKQNSVSVMYTGAGTKYTTKVGNNEESDVQALTSIDHAVYSLSTTDLTAATNQPLIITIKDDADATIGAIKLTVPAIVSGDKYSTSLVTSNDLAKATDIVVLDGATLTADDTKFTYNDVVVYPGGKLVIGKSGKLGMYTLTLRAGSSWGAAVYEYKYPEFVLNTTTADAYSNTSGKINLDYVTTKEQYYTFVAPFAVNTKDIKYPVDIYGNNVTATNTGSFEFQYYDGEARAEGKPGWKVVEEDPTNGATLTAGQGYTFLGMPKKINGPRQTYGIHRIPMTVAAATAMAHENEEQTAPLSVYLCDKNNNSGWNLIGNPYMSKIGGLTNNDIQVGKLVHTTDANGNWTGGWHWDEQTVQENQRFLVFPSNDGQSYEAVQASNATLPAFKNFFVQISNEYATGLSIPVANRVEKSLAPARYAEEQPEKDVEVAIVLEQDEAHSDQMDLLINNIYTANFDRDADFTKMMNATNLNLYGVHPYDNLSFMAMDHYTAEQSVKIGYQVPMAGEYTLRISDKPYVMWDKIEALYVTDHEMSPELTTNIMSEPYRFTVKNAETNNERFTISLKLKSEIQGPTTGWENIDVGKDHPTKFIHQDRLYILRNGIIYDATGQPIHTINK